MATVSQDGHRSNGSAPVDTADNPLHRLTPEQIEEIGREFDELHEQVKADLGDRDAKYIRSIIGLQRRLALLGRAELVASRWRIPWIVGASTLGLAKILENMEIGHNVLHGQWDWMNDPVINSRAWDWDTASTAEAWRHSHNFIHHTYTNILGKDRDLGYEIMRIDPSQKWHPIYLAQPFYNILLAFLFEWGVAVHDLDLEAIRKGEKSKEELLKELKGIAGKARTQIVKDYIAWPFISGLVMTLVDVGVLSYQARSESPAKRAAKRTAAKVAWRHGGPRARKAMLKRLVARRSFREPFIRTLQANALANVIRNVWSYAIIFCGHFPDQTYTFTQEDTDERDAWRLVRSSAHRGGEHRRRAAVPRDERQPRLPGRASPVPRHAEHPLRRDRSQGPRDLYALRAAVQLRALPPAARNGAAHDRAARLPGRQGAGEAGRIRRPARPRQGRARVADGQQELAPAPYRRQGSAAEARPTPMDAP